MSIATDLWFRNLRQIKPSGAKKPQRLDEISEYAAEETFSFMADNGPRIQTEFDDIFDGAMRKVIPLNDSDTGKILEIVRVLKDEGWHPPYVNHGPAVAFPTKQVKQKKQRRVGELPPGFGIPDPETNPDPRPVESYYVEVRVASFELVKEFEYTIPAGPREGETITKTNKTTMSRAIQNAVKFKRLRPELLDWWRQKQTFYTKNEDTYTLIEDAFEGNIRDDDWSIILSRHPVDVLRMSDLPGMESCHKEGRSHFKCAVAESKGNGLIAYLVKKSELDRFLRTAADDTDAQLQREAERSLWRWLDYRPRVDAAHKALNDTEHLEFLLDLIKTDIKAWNHGWRDYGGAFGDKMTEMITLDMVRDAVHAKLDNKPTWPHDDNLPTPVPISDFDQQEIFRDPQRGIPGIGATSRVRMRKFFDSASGDWFTVPERRLYGDEGADRFRTAVQEWAWEAQKFKFMDDDHLELPRASYLIRYGGSYEDTNDGPLLDAFFSMSGQDINEYGYSNVQHETEDEDDPFEEAQNELEEVLNTAQNRAEHIHFDAEVEGDEQPYVIGGADVDFSFDIEWEGAVDPNNEEGYVWPDEEREHTPIPKPWGGDWGVRSKFTQLLDDALGEHSNETEWDVSSDTIDVRFRFDFDNGSTPEEYDGFVDNLIDEIDDEYDEKFQKIRRALVLGGYLPPNDFDRLADDIVEQSKELVNWEVLGIDENDDIDDDGEVWFNFKPVNVSNTPSTLVYVPGKFPLTIGNTPEALRSIFGNSGTIEKRMIRPGVPFTNMVIQNSKPLVDAANGYVEQQLEFEFGDRYNRPSYEPLDFGHAMIRFNINSRINTTPPQPGEVYFTMKLVVEASSDEADIKGAFEFMRFIDRYPNQIIKIVIDTYEQFLDNKIKEVKDREARKLDGSDMRWLTQSLSSVYNSSAEQGDQAAEQAMLLIMFIQQNWGKFSRFEKLAAIDNYLLTLHKGTARPYGIWDNDGDKPNGWDGIVRAKMRLGGVANAGSYTWGSDWKPGADDKAVMQRTLGMSPEESVEAENTLQGLSDEERSNAMDALVRGDREEFVRIIRGSVNESLEEQIDRIDQMLNEREPIDLRVYKVALGCVVNTNVAGTDSQVENQIRGIREVTTVSHRVDLERNVGQNALYRVYEIKFELSGQQARDIYRDTVLVPSIEKEVTGVTVRDRGIPELADAPHMALREWGGLGYAAPPHDQYLPQMVTPRVSLDVVVDDWAEGGVQIYDTPMNTNQMQYHVMMPVAELWPHTSRFYRGDKNDFDGRYKHFIKEGPQMPVYVALGQNGRVKITGNEDIVWFAKRAGLEDVPVFFSYQKQV